jgi:hypothetical protein
MVVRAVLCGITILLGREIVQSKAAAVRLQLISALKPGQSLIVGQSISSQDGQFTLSLQADGDLLLRAQWGEALWTSGTSGQSATRVDMQEDGNLVIYNSTGQSLWYSGTEGNPGASLWVQDDGNLVILAPGDTSPLWESGTSLDLRDVKRELARRIVHWKLLEKYPIMKYSKIESVAWSDVSIDIDPSYGPLIVSDTTPSVLSRTSYENCSDAMDTQTWEVSEETTDAVNWTNTTVYNLGISLSVPIPAISGAASFEYSADTSEAQTYEHSVYRSQIFNIGLPPRSRIDVQWILQNESYTQTYTFLIRVERASMTIQHVLPGVGGAIDVYQVEEFLSPKEREFVVRGISEGVRGTRTEIVKRQSVLQCN